MSASPVSAVRAVWRSRRERAGGDRAYVLYAFILVLVIVIVPILRVLWITAGSTSALAVLTSAHTSVSVSSLAAALWAGGLLVGRNRGPALMPPFLLYVLVTSDIRRAVALRRPLICSAGIVVVACVMSSVFIGLILLCHGHAQLWGLMMFVAASAAVGIVTAVMWLLGQVFPRAALQCALSLLIFAGLSLFTPKLLVLMPWGWFGETYPPTAAGVLPLAGLAVLAAVLLAMTPMFVNRLTGMQLSAQAVKWEQTKAFSYSFDFHAAASVYEAVPRIGRGIRAVPHSRRRWVTFFVRDGVGQIRTPGRSLGAIAATVTAGVLITYSFLPGTPFVFLSGAAGVVAYWASAALAKGLRYAARVAGDYPLYGISDRRLILLHGFFPLAALLAVLSTTATVSSLISGTPIGLAIIGACALGVLALALRLSSALKGLMPPGLLAPINTPAGDFSIVLQMCWAFGDPLIAILGALTIPMLPASPIPLLLVMTGVGGLILFRWRKRR